MFLLRLHNHQARRHGAEVFMSLRRTQWQWRELAFRTERRICGKKIIKRLVAAVMKLKVVWDRIQCQMTVSCRRFGRSWYLLFRVLASYKVSKSVDGMDSDECDYILITKFMHWLLFIHKILFSSTCFEPQVLTFRRIQLYACSIWYRHSLWEYVVACRYTVRVRTDSSCVPTSHQELS